MESLQLQQSVPGASPFQEFLSSSGQHGSQSPLYSGEVDPIVDELDSRRTCHDGREQPRGRLVPVHDAPDGALHVYHKPDCDFDLEDSQTKCGNNFDQTQPCSPSGEHTPRASELSHSSLSHGSGLPPSRSGSQNRKCCGHAERPASLVSSSPSASRVCSRVCSNGLPSSTPPGSELAWGTFCPNCQLSQDTLENLACDNCSSSTFSAGDIRGPVATPVREDSTTLSLSEPSQDQASSSTDISCHVNRPKQYTWSGQENGHAVTMATCSLMVTMDNGNGPVHTHAHRGDDKFVYARPKDLVAASVLLILPAPPCGLAALYFAVRACRCHKNGRFEEVRKFSRRVLYCCCMGLVFFVAFLVFMIVRFHMTYSSLPTGFQYSPTESDQGLFDINGTFVQVSNSSGPAIQEKTIPVPFDPEQLFKPGLGIPTNLTKGEKLDELFRQIRNNSSFSNINS